MFTIKFQLICLTLSLGAIPLAFTHAQTSIAVPTQVTFQAADGVQVYADIHRSAKGKKAPLVILFHQGGADARGEYGSYIAPRLVRNGFNVIAVDQRLGGDLFKMSNRTVSGLPGNQFGFCDAYPDLEAALRYAKKEGFKGDRFVWGSSYSATLVMRLASENRKELTGVLAFSPAGGEPMSGCQPGDYAPAVKVPVLVMRPASEMQRETSKQQFELFERLKFKTYIAANGVHGSSMLHPERVIGGVEDHWKIVLDFIRRPAGD